MKFRGNYAFLSNFHPAEVTIRLLDGSVRSVPTVEHGFQAMKCQYLSQQVEIAECATPVFAKRMAGQVAPRQDWLERRYDIMSKLVQQKFKYHPELQAQLLATGQMPLVEDNEWHDNYWGNCTCQRCSANNGNNMLGKILMEVREELSNG